MSQLIKRLNREFSLKDLGRLSYFLGIEVKYFTGGLFLSQAKYTKDLLTRANLLASAPMATPLSAKPTPRYDDHHPVDATAYRSLVGALQYLTFTRPDIQHAVNHVCQFFQVPTQIHLQAVKRILRYLCGTLDYGLRFLAQSSNSLRGCSDADWAGCPLTRRSTTGFWIYFGSNCISWSSKKQPTVSRSSTEAEYRAMASTTAELTWISYLLDEIGFTYAKPIQLYCDNMGALHLSINPIFHGRTKHIQLDYHFVREKVASGLLNTCYLHTSRQVADMFTKPLNRIQFLFFRDKLGVHKIPLSSLWGADKLPAVATSDSATSSLLHAAPTVKDNSNKSFGQSRLPPDKIVSLKIQR